MPHAVQRQLSAVQTLACPICLVESSTLTVTLLELHVQSLEKHLFVCVLNLSIIVLTMQPAPDPVTCLTICSVFLRSFYQISLSALHGVTALVLCIFAKFLDHFCLHFWQLLLRIYVLPLPHISVTCHRIALSLLWNQCFRHDYLVRVVALSSWSTVLPHGLRVRSVVYGITLLVLISNLIGIFSSALADFQLSSECLCTPLVCIYPLESYPELGGSGGTSVPTGGGRAYLFSHPSVALVIKNSNNQLSSA
jgi:hypothetical protein